MRITLHELELQKVNFQVDVPPGEIELDQKVTQSSILHARGVAELISHSAGEIRLHGNLQVAVSAPCDRCLDPVSLAVETPFDLVYLPASEASDSTDEEIENAAIEIGYYEGNGLELNDVLREVVLLALPMQSVCGESCKGICPICGQNRNQKNCGCQPAALDDRWNKLKDLRTEIGHQH